MMGAQRNDADIELQDINAGAEHTLGMTSLQSIRDLVEERCGHLLDFRHLRDETPSKQVLASGDRQEGCVVLKEIECRLCQLLHGLFRGKGIQIELCLTLPDI